MARAGQHATVIASYRTGTHDSDSHTRASYRMSLRGK